jgi:methyl-accepting chemotaxis protein
MISAFSVSLIVEVTLAALLCATLICCLRLDRRLRHLRSDQENLSGTVRALNAAVTAAQTSLAGLRAAAQDADESLGRKVSSARGLADELSVLTSAGERIAARIESARASNTAHAAPRTKAAFGETLRALR